MSETTTKFSDLNLKIAVGKKPLPYDVALRTQGGVGSINISDNVCILDVENKVSIYLEEEGKKFAYNSLENCVFLVITKKPLSRSYFIPVPITDIEKIDSTLHEFMIREGEKFFIVNGTSSLIKDNLVIGRHNTNSSWPVEYASVEWVEITQQVDSST